MPFFGLVWVASWVGCFFASSHDLLRVPCQLPEVLSNSFHSPHQLKARFVQAALLRQNLTTTPHPQTKADRAIASASTQPLPPQLSRWSAAIQALVGRDRDSVPSAIRFNNQRSLQSLMFGVQMISGVPHAPLAVKVTQTPRQSNLRPAQIGLGDAAASDLGDRPVFQIWVREYLVAETLTEAEAQQIADQLQHLISQVRRHRNLDPTLLQPQLHQGKLSGIWGDRILFSVDPALARRWQCHPELLTIHWVNNLRQALAAPALDVTTAQQVMHRLAETPQRIKGVASWYGPWFHGRQTAAGEKFDQTQLTAAHPSLPFNTYLKVTNLKNGRSVVVRVNDRGPYLGGRTLDLSRAAAQSLNSEQAGVVPIEAVVLKPHPLPIHEGAIAQKF